MTRNRNLLANSAQATQAAKLPGLSKPKTGDWAGLSRWIDAVTEHLQLRQGGRRSTLEATVTQRELQEITGATQIIASGATQKTGVLMQLPNGDWATLSIDAFAQLIRNTALYKDLLKRLDDPTRFDRLSPQLKELLLPDLNALAKQRGADIQQFETRVQDAAQSMASRVTEVTAALDQATAGLRQTMFAQATQTFATAAYALQITARLDDLGGAGIEEIYSVTADRLTGLEAQWVLKTNAGGAFASIGVASTSTAEGVGDSAIILVANRLAFVRPSDIIGSGAGEIDPTSPDTSLIPFGVDGSGVYINGTVRINTGGATLDSLAASTGIYISYTSNFWKVDSTGTAVNTTITLTANFTSGLSGTVTWTKSGAGTAPPGAGTSNTYTLNAADQTDDTCTYTATFVDGATTYTDSITIVRLRDGSNALTGLLTNESHTVPSSSTGVVSDYTGAAGSFRVYKGSTLLATPDVSFALAPSGNPDGLTYSINATTGAYSVTASGSWANASKTTTLTFRATIGSTTLDKVFTITKANAGTAGTNGTAGARGTVVGQGPAYGISDSSWSNGHANRVVSNIINGASLTTTLASTALNKIGDTVTLSNSTTYAETRIWDGTAWSTAGVLIVGNLFVNGTIAGSQINSTGMDAGPAHEFQVNNSTGQVTSTKFFGYNSQFSNTFDPTQPAAKCLSYAGSSTAETFLSSTHASNAGSNAHAIRGVNNHSGSSGLVGLASAYDFYAEGSGTNYGPFTGAHDGLLSKRMLGVEEGDIVVDVECVARRNMSNTLFVVAPSAQPNQRGGIGVLATRRMKLDPLDPPAALVRGFAEERTEVPAKNGSGTDVLVRHLKDVDPVINELKRKFHRIAFNAVGEGQVNVCGEGGNIRRGDLIVTSSMRGKGMRQADDIVRGCTVAKAREDVAFASADEVKTVACIYLCG